MTVRRNDDLTELLQEVRRIEVQSSRLVTDAMAGGYNSVFRGAGIEFDEVREYAEGDDPRTVDWNVTARVGRPHVKKFVDERQMSVLFLLDLSASMDGGFGIWSGRQTAARVCACLALAAVRNNDKVGMVAFSSGVDKFVPPKKGLGHALRIVRDCLALPGSTTRTAIAPALEFAASVVRKRAVVFVLSDFQDTGWTREMARCMQRHDVIAVRLLFPELVPPESGLVRIRDPETGRDLVVDWRSPAVRTRYAEQVERWRAATADELRKVKVDLMDVPVPRTPGKDLVARPIMHFFQMRELRGAKR